MGLPLLQRLQPALRRPQALIVAPTRELAAQIAAELRLAGKALPGLRVLPLCGGEPLGGQILGLGAGAHVLVGTPGRLLDHLRHGRVDLGLLGALVLDEADRLLDLGFREALGELIGLVQQGRGEGPPLQAVLLSATWPEGVRELAGALLREPELIAVPAERAPLQLFALPCADAEQRLPALRAMLERLNPASALLFCNLKRSADELAGLLPGALALHGDHEQGRRNDVLAAFRLGSARLLVATDVAGRGIDVEGVELVVHVDLPPTPEAAVHRSGRTGRAGLPGLCALLARPGDRERWGRLWPAEVDPPELIDEPPPLHLAPHPRWATLKVGAGRRDRLRPGDLLGALTRDLGLPGDEVGRIEIGERVSWVGLRPEGAAQALRRLDRVKGQRVRLELVR
jgi:ATP-independent RNA helicase DbpA